MLEELCSQFLFSNPVRFYAYNEKSKSITIISFLNTETNMILSMTFSTHIPLWGAVGKKYVSNFLDLVLQVSIYKESKGKAFSI